MGCGQNLAAALVGNFVKTRINVVCGLVLSLRAGDDEADESNAFFGRILSANIDVVQGDEPAGWHSVAIIHCFHHPFRKAGSKHSVVVLTAHNVRVGGECQSAVGALDGVICDIVLDVAVNDGGGLPLAEFFAGTFPNDLHVDARIFKIYWPICFPAVTTLGVFSLIGYWNDYYWPLMIISDKDYRTLSLAIAQYKNVEGMGNWSQEMAAAVVATVPMIILFLVARKKLIGNITEGAVKG